LSYCLPHGHPPSHWAPARAPTAVPSSGHTRSRRVSSHSRVEPRPAASQCNTQNSITKSM
jgi:hypothetical protein